MNEAFDSGRAADVGDAGLPGGGGALELVNNQEVTGSAVTSVTLSGLDGDTDQMYVLFFRVKKAVASALNLDLQPNGVTTNQASVGRSDGTGGAGSFSATRLRIMQHGGANVGDLSAGQVFIDAKTGTFRTTRAMWSDIVSIVDFAYNSVTGLWTDTATNITSIDCVASVANSIDVGSYFRIYRVLR